MFFENDWGCYSTAAVIDEPLLIATNAKVRKSKLFLFSQHHFKYHRLWSPNAMAHKSRLQRWSVIENLW